MGFFVVPTSAAQLTYHRAQRMLQAAISPEEGDAHLHLFDAHTLASSFHAVTVVGRGNGNCVTIMVFDWSQEAPRDLTTIVESPDEFGLCRDGTLPDPVVTIRQAEIVVTIAYRRTERTYTVEELRYRWDGKTYSLAGRTRQVKRIPSPRVHRKATKMK